MSNEVENEEGSKELIEYRLSNIEKTLAKMETLLTANQLQDRDIQDLKKNQEELENAYNAHDQRLRKLEEAPAKQRAERWTQAVDTVAKIVLSAIALIVLAKIGLQ